MVIAGALLKIVLPGNKPERLKSVQHRAVIHFEAHCKCPNGIVPFSERNRAGGSFELAVGFHEMDVNFAEVLISPESYIDDFRRFAAMISPDCSLYRDAPLEVQLTNIYRNRAIGSYYQRHGVYVIPQIRWGTELTYTTDYFPEKVAFLGVEKHSIVAVGTYGCIDSREDKYYFQAGLEAMLETLEPEVVLVYGAMPETVFGSYLHLTRFVQYDNWIKAKHYPCLEDRVSNKVTIDNVSGIFADYSLLADEPDRVSLI